MTDKKHANAGNQNAKKLEPLDAYYKLRISSKELESAKKRHGVRMANNIRDYLRDS